MLLEFQKIPLGEHIHIVTNTTKWSKGDYAVCNPRLTSHFLARVVSSDSSFVYYMKKDRLRANCIYDAKKVVASTDKALGLPNIETTNEYFRKSEASYQMQSYLNILTAVYGMFALSVGRDYPNSPIGKSGCVYTEATDTIEIYLDFVGGSSYNYKFTKSGGEYVLLAKEPESPTGQVHSYTFIAKDILTVVNRVFQI
jgi:hypothetical protein